MKIGDLSPNTLVVNKSKETEKKKKRGERQ